VRLWRHSPGISRLGLRGGILLSGLVLVLTAAGSGIVQTARPVAAMDAAARPQAPSPRYSPAMAYDGARRSVVLFGGATVDNNFLSDTWTWNGHRWTQLHPAHAPSARGYSEMAYDPVHRQVVLFGGLGLNDTWLWDGSDWTQATPTFIPNQAIEEGMTFFAATGTVVMYSGDFSGATHLYSWDGADWTDLPFTGGPPPSTFQGGLSVDPERDVLVLLAPDANDFMLQPHPALHHWEFDGKTWTERAVVTPPARSLVQTATDEQTDTIVMFGGVGFNDTWAWDGQRWTQRHPRHSPPSLSSTGPMPGMAYDAARGEVVVFGGMNYANNVVQNDTWTWNGRDWHLA